MNGTLLWVWGAGVVLAGCVLGWAAWWWRGQAVHHRQACDRLAEQVRVLALAEHKQPLDKRSVSPALQHLVAAIQMLAAERDRWRDGVHTQLAEAHQDIRQERNRLAALMSELSQSVVVCNLDGRIVLFNSRARWQFKQMAGASSLAGGAEWMGIGRSIYAALDRAMLDHALAHLRQRMARGAHPPTTEFLTLTASGHWMRVHMAPVRSADAVGADRGAGADEIHGFVLTLENVTHSVSEDTRRGQSLLELTEQSRASLAQVQGAIETLSAEGLPPELRDQVLRTLRQEVDTMGQRLNPLAAHAHALLRTRWPREDQLGADLVEAAHVLSHGSRPEYYDFDLFQMSESHHALDDRPLKHLRCTVFDTETTGLNPTRGDEIIQIGAVRIVNGRLLRQDAFEQLIDPGRSISPESIPIHGITPSRVQGQPRIAQVLPAFHAYASDTVLVAHNAAFDMKFLQLKERSTGVRFDQPVLDTLLLSAVVHPHQASHRLEAIAERLNITVVGRHTALGDALLTAEVFLRMVPLLAAMGIHTLGQAREASQATHFARLHDGVPRAS